MPLPSPAEPDGTTAPVRAGMRAQVDGEAVQRATEVQRGRVAWQEIAELLEAAYRTAAPRRLVIRLDAHASPSDAAAAPDRDTA